MARSACLAALVDGLGGLAPNVYTRPLGYLRDLDRDRGTAWAAEAEEALGLLDDAEEIEACLRRIGGVVAARFPADRLPAGLHASTRSEYAYFLAEGEREYRLSVARELAERGDRPSAVAYLRFFAYTLARIPMVDDAARSSERAVSLLRPDRPVGPALEGLCPEILGDLGRILGGPRGVDPGDVERGLDSLRIFHEHALASLGLTRLDPAALRPWLPFEPGPSPSRPGNTGEAPHG